VKRFLAIAAGGLGIGAFLRRRRRASKPVEPENNAFAEELREKLAESRAAESAAPEATSLETDLEARRREVHERAKRSIEELG
jgi:hypothetical protein